MSAFWFNRMAEHWTVPGGPAGALGRQFLNTRAKEDVAMDDFDA